MSTVGEIEQAIEQLSEQDLARLRSWLLAREVRPALAKWHGRGTGLVRKMGGVDGYLRQVRSGDQDE